MSASDLFARVPPETGHVDELGILVEERGQCVRIAVIPRFHEHDDDILWPIDGRLAHGSLSSTGEGPLLGLESCSSCSWPLLDVDVHIPGLVECVQISSVSGTH